MDLGKLFKVHIRHDNSSFSPAWFLDSIEVSEGRDKVVFHCERWLAKNKDDGKISRTLYVKVSVKLRWKKHIKITLPSHNHLMQE